MVLIVVLALIVWRIVAGRRAISPVVALPMRGMQRRLGYADVQGMRRVLRFIVHAFVAVVTQPTRFNRFG